jgi:hypothetical protein
MPIVADLQVGHRNGFRIVPTEINKKTKCNSIQIPSIYTAEKAKV